MVRFYWYGLTFIFLACCGVGMALGAALGAGGAIAGAALGAVAAGGLTTVLNTQDKMETAFYATLSVVFAVALLWLVFSFWGLTL